MKKEIWDLYAPVYKKAMQADQKIYDFMYERIPAKIRDMEVLEIATGPGLLAKHVAPAAKRMIATDYSDDLDQAQRLFARCRHCTKAYLRRNQEGWSLSRLTIQHRQFSYQ